MQIRAALQLETTHDPCLGGAAGAHRVDSRHPQGERFDFPTAGHRTNWDCNTPPRWDFCHVRCTGLQMGRPRLCGGAFVW